MEMQKLILELQAEVKALKKSHIQEWTEIRKEQLDITQRQNELTTKVNTLLQEARILMGTQPAMQTGAGTTPNLTVVLNALAQISAQMSDLSTRLAKLETTICPPKKA